MTELTATPPRRLEMSVMLAMAGVVAFLLFVLALFLPGQNIHGGTLTGFTLLFGISVPPLSFVGGLVVAFVRRRQGHYLGMWLNSAGLFLYVLWVSGALNKILG